MENMQKKPVSIIEALKYGFVTFFDHIGFYIKTMLIEVGVVALGVLALVALGAILFHTQIAHQYIMDILTLNVQFDCSTGEECVKQLFATAGAKEFLILVGCAIFIMLPIIFLLSLGWVKIALDMYDRNFSTTESLFYGFKIIVKGIVSGLLYSAVLMSGLLLLIIPGLIFGVIFSFYEQIIVDKNLGIIASFRESVHLTKGIRWHIFGLFILFSFLQRVGGIIGWVLIAPIKTLTMTYLYRKQQEVLLHSPVTRF